MRQPVGAFPAFTSMPSGGRQAGTTILARKGRAVLRSARRHPTFTGDPQADAAISDIVRYPHLPILGCITDRAVLDVHGWRDIPTDCRFLIDYEIDEEEWGARKKPWQARWGSDRSPVIIADKELE